MRGRPRGADGAGAQGERWGATSESQCRMQAALALQRCPRSPAPAQFPSDIHTREFSIARLVQGTQTASGLSFQSAAHFSALQPAKWVDHSMSGWRDVATPARCATATWRPPQSSFHGNCKGQPRGQLCRTLIFQSWPQWHTGTALTTSLCGLVNTARNAGLKAWERARDSHADAHSGLHMRRFLWGAVCLALAAADESECCQIQLSPCPGAVTTPSRAATFPAASAQPPSASTYSRTPRPPQPVSFQARAGVPVQHRREPVQRPARGAHDDHG